MNCKTTRRELLSLTGLGLASLAASPAGFLPAGNSRRGNGADIQLRIGQITLDLSPKHPLKTLAYNGQVPGPFLRVREGQEVTVDVVNDTDADEMVHWHGFHIPSEVDGVHEEGTPHVPRHGQQRYVFTPRPAGTRWYHSHVHSGSNFQTGTYSGQLGMIVVEPRDHPGRFDQDVPILLHEWDPRLSREGAVDVEYRLFSINGKMLGAGEPIRVRRSQRVLFRILNASATMIHRLALAGHVFNVIAMDGNALAVERRVPVLELGPGERIDAIVEMNEPGVWVLGETRESQRQAGMGIVVEYAGANGPASFSVQPGFVWDYTAFGVPAPGASGPEAAVQKIPMVFRPRGDHQWTINSKSFPKTDLIKVQAGQRYRMLFDNQSAHAHPVHLHRHTFELTRVVDQATSGVRKDVVVVPAWRSVEVDFTADNPGPTLFHCHQQFHMDFGFMAMMQYAG